MIAPNKFKWIEKDDRECRLSKLLRQLHTKSTLREVEDDEIISDDGFNDHPNVE